MTADEKVRDMLAKIGESLPEDRIVQAAKLMEINELRMLVAAMPPDTSMYIEDLEQRKYCGLIMGDGTPADPEKFGVISLKEV